MMRNGRGRFVQLGVVTMNNMAKHGQRPIKTEPVSTMHTPGRMSMKHLQKHLCDGYKCEGCEVMCAYGRRYLELKEAESACGGF